MATSRGGGGLRSALLRPDAGNNGGCSSASLVTDDVGDTMTERPPPAREPRDSGLSPSRDDLPGRALPATCGEEAVLSERAPRSSVVSCGSRDRDAAAAAAAAGENVLLSIADDVDDAAADGAGGGGGGSKPGNGRPADDAPSRCGRANGKNSDDDAAYMAASADSRELSSDGQSA